MPYIPHTTSEIEQMLNTIGVKNIDELFDEIPKSIQIDSLEGVPDAVSEMEIGKIMQALSVSDQGSDCYLGAGAYEHYIPAAIWQLVARGEFYTAYTPYQAEASQGTLQLCYEFQSMIAKLTSMEVSNASLYDGASGLAEAVLMAVRSNRKSKCRRILVPRSLNPRYREVVNTLVSNQNITIDEINFDKQTGQLDLSQLPVDEITALVISQPNYFGTLEEVDVLTNWAHEKNALVIAVVNPISLAMLRPPGEWGEKGADIACGEGQPLGVPLSGGGPYFGFMACRQSLVRQMPGRIIGRTIDADGKTGFALTLQAREQHIRRSKATSNICTNQGLMIVAATIYMALMGPTGLKNIAECCHKNTLALRKKVLAIDGVEAVFNGTFFHETVIRTDKKLDNILSGFVNEGIVGGVSLKADFPELGEAWMFCVTETKNEKDVKRYCQVLDSILHAQSVKSA